MVDAEFVVFEISYLLQIASTAQRNLKLLSFSLGRFRSD